MDRPLSGLERRFYLAALPSRINVVACARVEGRVEPDAWRRALAALQRRHPLLGAHVVDREGDLRFDTAGTAPIPLRVLPRTGPEHRLALIDEEMHEPFPGGRAPLARSVVLADEAGADALLTCHHAIGDALAVLTAFRDAFEALQRLGEGAAQPLEPLPDAPPMGALLPPDAPGSGMLPALLRYLWLRPRQLPAEGRAPPRERRSRLLHDQLDEAATKALADACKGEGTSVHGATMAAALLAAAPELPGGRGALAVNSPVSMRPLLPALPPEAFGYYAWGVTTMHRVGPDRGFWELAREARDAVQAQVQAKAPLASLARLEAAEAKARRRRPPNAEEAAAIAARVERYHPALQVSSFGRLDAPERYGALRWREFLAVDNKDTGGPALGFASHTFRGRLTLDLVHPEPLVGRERAARVHARALRHLREAAGG